MARPRQDPFLLVPSPTPLPPKIKLKKPHVWYKLNQECRFLNLSLQCIGHPPFPPISLPDMPYFLVSPYRTCLSFPNLPTGHGVASGEAAARSNPFARGRSTNCTAHGTEQGRCAFFARQRGTKLGCTGYK
eukprot:2701808-Rhodomonas_salina.3